MNNYEAINLYFSNCNIITGNNLYDNTDGRIGDGVCLSFSSYNNITHNYISNNYRGISLYLSKANTITKNTIQNHSILIGFWGPSVGVYIDRLSNKNIIEENNFIGNKRQASFSFSWRNTWDSNYWDTWIGLKINLPIFQKFPKVIVGFLGINFDWHPAQEPYDISDV